MAESATSSDGYNSGVSSTTNVPETLLRLNKCSIRRHHPSDAEALAKEANNPNVAKGMSDHWPQPYRVKDAHDWMSSTSSGSPPYGFVICRPEDNVPIGSMGIEEREKGDGSALLMGYCLGEPYWGRGIATEFISAITQWCFENFEGMQRMEADAYAWNGASCRALEKAGFTYQGRKENAARKDGEDIDFLLYYKERS